MIKQIISNIRKKIYISNIKISGYHAKFTHTFKEFLARINIAAGVLIITQVIIFKDKSMRDSQH